jgi:hypothetical protein
MQDTSPPVTPSPPRRRSALPTLFVALIAFLLGGALVAVAATRGYLAAILDAPQSMIAQPATPPPASNAAQMSQIGSVEGRLAMIEDRLSRVDVQTSAAAGNAGRAEGMLIAFAARRLVERGEPLGTVADQLRLRFTNAQPLAVQTVVQFAANPVTIDGLSARLEALSPELTVTETDHSLWDRVRREVTSLFVVRRDSGALGTPSARIERARLMLTARRIDAAIGEVERLPGADAADTWITDARRFEAAQRALDLLETTAMLEPNRLQDSQGQSIDQPSPLAPTAPQGDPTEAAAAAE